MMLRNQSRVTLIKIIILFVLFLSVNKIIAQNEIPDNIKDHILKGVELLESSKTPDDIEDAYALFYQASEIVPGYPDVHYFLGKTLSLMQGNTERAIKELKLYLELYPSAPDKDQVSSEIKELEKLVGLRKDSYLMGISLVELTDGIYVHRVSPNYPPFGRRGVPIKTGDKIIKINSIDVSESTLQDVMQIFEADSLELEKPRKIVVIRGGQEYSLDMYKRKKDFDPIIKDLGEGDLESIIMTVEKPLVVYFVSDWCDDCQKYFNDRTIQNPTYEYRNEMTFIYVNIDERSDIASEYEIKTAPVIHLYKNGMLIDKIIGYDRDLFIKKASELLE